MKLGARTLRTIAGVAVLVGLLAIGAFLIPPYVQNWKLQRYVTGLIDDAATSSRATDAVRDDVVNRAVSLGLPVHPTDVQVTRSHEATRIDVLYIVHVDVGGYSVDLHFRPQAGGN